MLSVKAGMQRNAILNSAIALVLFNDRNAWTQRDISKTYQTLKFRDSGDLIVSQFQCRYVVVAGQLLEIRAFDLIIGEFHLKSHNDTDK